jgi:aminoglycoside/choline kinase family phosphotransferase
MEMQYITNLFENWSNQKTEKIIPLPQSGSYRRYFRLISKSKTAIAVINNDLKENIAFVSFSRHFKSKQLPVPEIYAEELKKNIYLQQDLGDISLYDYLKNNNGRNNFNENSINIYRKVIDQLVKIQILGQNNFDYSKCYPRSDFDRQSIMWDLNYFKYYFLKIAKVPFYEQDIENDFKTFADFLLQADNNFFLFRDFQSRNIMLVNNEPYFIDYQGGRRGALQYDLVSLLYDAKANIPQEIRNSLVDYYIGKANELITLNKSDFYKFYPAFSLIRVLQALGAFGFRGLIEKKLHFTQSIPPAIENLKYILTHLSDELKIPHLVEALNYLTEKSELSKSKKSENPDFDLQIKSFSYKAGIPKDETEHGGGFIFDCRLLPNPGRIDEYKTFSGLDKKVIDFLNAEIEVEMFISEIYRIVENVIMKYKEKNFNYLAIYFGCTGGQHRSVYCAEKLAVIIREEFNITAKIEHTQKEKWRR